MKIREGSFYSGGGGGLLGSLLLDWETKFYVERELYCQQIIRQRRDDGYLPGGPIFTDIHLFAHHAGELRGMVDIATGGIPCQPFSVAGRRLGEADERNLWPVTRQCLCLLGCEYGYFENVPGFASGAYFPRVLGEFSESGFDADWRILSAAEVGAPHKRDRLWIVVNSQQRRCGGESWRWTGQEFKNGYSGMEKMRCKNGEGESKIMFPTPGVSDALGSKTIPNDAVWTGKTVYRKDGSKIQLGLREAVKLWPTPRSADGDKMNKVYGNGELTLTGAIQKFPTPNASNSTGAGAHGDGGMNLQTFVNSFPTPTSRDYKSGKGKTQVERGRKTGPSLSESCKGQLNPDWVEWLMGWPIGWTSLDPLPRGNFEEWWTRMHDGSWWDDEHNIPRVARKVPNRTARIKAIGNGQVPLCMATAWKLLIDDI